MRYALRYSSDPAKDARVMQAYMPSNYSVRMVTAPAGRAILIEGEDSHGWTLDGYVCPRLASGNYYAREITAEEAALCQPLETPAP